MSGVNEHLNLFCRMKVVIAAQPQRDSHPDRMPRSQESPTIPLCLVIPAWLRHVQKCVALSSSKKIAMKQQVAPQLQPRSEIGGRHLSSRLYSEWWQSGASRSMKMDTIRSPWRYDAAAPSAKLARDPQALRHQAMHALLGGVHLADAAIHRHAGERIGVEPRQRFLLLQELDHVP